MRKLVLCVLIIILAASLNGCNQQSGTVVFRGEKGGVEYISVEYCPTFSTTCYTQQYSGIVLNLYELQHGGAYQVGDTFP